MKVVTDLMHFSFIHKVISLIVLGQDYHGDKDYNLMGERGVCNLMDRGMISMSPS